MRTVLVVAFVALLVCSVSASATNATEQLSAQSGSQTFVAQVARDYDSDGAMIRTLDSCRPPDVCEPECNPRCEWQCDKPACPVTCEPACHPPNCKVSCGEPGCPQCQTFCEPSDCHVACQKTCPMKDQCPLCDIQCAPLKCETRCTTPVVKCENICETPSCKWDCTRGPCPAPTCRLVCQKPSCSPLPHCCPCHPYPHNTPVVPGGEGCCPCPWSQQQQQMQHPQAAMGMLLPASQGAFAFASAEVSPAHSQEGPVTYDYTHPTTALPSEPTHFEAESVPKVSVAHHKKGKGKKGWASDAEGF